MEAMHLFPEHHGVYLAAMLGVAVSPQNPFERINEKSCTLGAAGTHNLFTSRTNNHPSLSRKNPLPNLLQGKEAQTRSP
jgi:hypothetical protein